MEKKLLSAENSAKTVLVVDDSAISRTLVVHIIQKLGYQTIQADNGDACIELLNTRSIDLLLLDIHMPGKNGLEILDYIREKNMVLPVIMISGSSDIEQAIQSLKLGAYTYLLKPVEPGRLEITLKNALNEFELRRKVRLFSAAITESPFGVAITDRNGIIEYTNPGFTTITGYAEDEARGKNIGILKSGRQSRAFYSKFWKTIESGRIWQGEIVNRRKNGDLYTEHCIVSPIPDTNGTITHFISIKQDVTLRKKEQEALAESEQRFQEFADLVPQPLFETDNKGNITFANHTGLQLFGYSKAEIENDFSCLRLFAPEDQERIRTAIASSISNTPIDNHEYTALKKDGSTFPILIYSSPIIRNGKPSGLRGIGLDITERKRGELQLMELNQTLEERVEERTRELEITHQQMVLQEKLASIGQLAAGLAHEINNPVNFLRINLASLKEDVTDLRLLLEAYRAIIRSAETRPPSPEELQKLEKLENQLSIDHLLDDLPVIFDESERGFERISTIIGSMRNFSFRHAVDQRVQFDINKGIRDTLIIARNEYRYHAEIETNLQEIPMVSCNPEQINQVFLNLIINSAHAIASQKRANKGNITIATSCSGNDVICTVSDDGPGIPPETRSRIFEPFFTTKEPGKGTGLGLSISYDIITRKHGGTISATCPPSGGSTFTITLPLNARKEIHEP
ncbi:PAS domain S-box protein [Chlorobium limicola]